MGAVDRMLYCGQINADDLSRAPHIIMPGFARTCLYSLSASFTSSSGVMPTHIRQAWPFEQAATRSAIAAPLMHRTGLQKLDEKLVGTVVVTSQPACPLVPCMSSRRMTKALASGADMS